MSAARKMRRLGQKHPLAKASEGLGRALDVMKTLGGLGELETLVRGSHQMVQAVVGDVQLMSDRIESLEERLAALEAKGKDTV